MSRGEPERVEVLGWVASKELKTGGCGGTAAYRQVKRWWRRYSQVGGQGLKHEMRVESRESQQSGGVSAASHGFGEEEIWGGEEERFGGPRHDAAASESRDHNSGNIKRGHF